MIHRAIFGSIERFVAVMIEHTAGKFPVWLAPTQAIVLPVSEKYHEYAEKVLTLLKNYDIRALIDDRNEKMGRKIRDAELQRVPFMLVVGEKEQNEETVAVRRQGKGDLGSFTVADFAASVQQEIKETIGE